MTMSPGSSSGCSWPITVVDRLAGLDHHHDRARPLERRHEGFERVAGDELARACFDRLLQEAGLAIEGGHPKPVIEHVEGQIAAHHRHPDHSKLGFVGSHLRGPLLQAECSAEPGGELRRRDPPVSIHVERGEHRIGAGPLLAGDHAVAVEVVDLEQSSAAR